MDIMRRFVLAVAAVAIAPAWVTAQGLTGAIEGRITDQTGGILPGVTVVVTSPSLVGGMQSRTSEADGRFRFRVLPPGTYAVTFELSGFQTVKRADIIVQTDRTVTLDQTLSAAAVAESITVTGESPVVDVRSTAVANVIDTTTIQLIPVARRFTDVLNTMPGVQNGLYTFSPINAVYGSKVTDNVYQVDGINFVDPNVSAPITDVAYDDIAEVQVSTSGQSAEFGSASGGVFNFITKSGSNQFRGLASTYVQNKQLTDNNISTALSALGIRPTVFDHQYDYGGNLGGPIKRDRLFFFGSYYRFDQNQSISDFPVPIPTKQWQTTVKIDAQLPGTNRLTGMFNYRDRTWEPFNFGFTTASDPKTWIGIQWKNPLSTIGWTATPTSNTVLQARFGLALFDLVNYEPNAVPGTPVYIEQNTGVITGGPNGNFGVQNRDRYAMKADLSRFVQAFGGGSHDLKVGFEYEWLRLDNNGRDQAGASGVQHQLLGGVPFRVVLRNVEARRRTSIDHWATYVQDQWALGSRLTVNAGLRFDRWTGGLGPDELFGSPFFEPQTIAKATGLVELTNVAPRVGLAWDVRGDRKVAVKASWGRFYQRIDGTTISVATSGRTGNVTHDWLDCRLGGAPATCQTAGALPGDRLLSGAAELGTVRGDTRPTGRGAIDPDLKMPFTDSFNAGVEWDLGGALGASATYIYKRERDIWNRVNLAWFDLGASDPYARAYNRYNVTNPFGGPLTIYSIRPEFQALPPNQLLTNPSNPVDLHRDYNGLELVLRRRLQDGWSLMASYNLGKSEGTSGTLFFDHQGHPYLNPNNLTFIGGDLGLDRRHMFKINGLYQLPFGINASTQLQVLSGLPWYTSGSGGAGVSGATYVRFNRGVDYPTTSVDPFIRVPGQPQGSERFETEVNWDIRVERRTALGGGKSVDLSADIFNLLNRNTTVRFQTLNQDLANYLRPAQILSPRAVRLAIRFSF